MNTIEKANKIFKILSGYNPNPTTELVYSTPFTLLIAVILSAQSTDRAVNLVTKSLFKKYDTPEKIFQLGESGLKDYIKSIGLYNQKAKYIIGLCELLTNRYRQQIPNDLETLMCLPGIGRKSANVILNCLFQQPVIAVDTHVFRVAKRLGLAQGDTVRKVEKALLQVIAQQWLTHAHHWLVLHGRYICKARAPKCNICPLTQYCAYYKEF